MKNQMLLEGITLAVQKMPETKLFYEQVFRVQFSEEVMHDQTLYMGQMGSIWLQLCPASLAGNTARQNRHQLSLVVNNLTEILKKVEANGGKIMEEIPQQNGVKSVAIYDPDDNSLVLKSMKIQEKPTVTGLGGIFFKSKDPVTLKKWYEEMLGIPAGEYGISFQWGKPGGSGYSVWCPFEENTQYFGKEPQQYMINYRVANLEELLEHLKSKGVTIAGEMEKFDYGKFAWIIDLEGNRIELWEPDDWEYDKIKGNSMESQ